MRPLRMTGGWGAPGEHTQESQGRVPCFLGLAFLCVPSPPYSKRAEAHLVHNLLRRALDAHAYCRAVDCLRAAIAT